MDVSVYFGIRYENKHQGDTHHQDRGVEGQEFPHQNNKPNDSGKLKHIMQEPAFYKGRHLKFLFEGAEAPVLQTILG